MLNGRSNEPSPGPPERGPGYISTVNLASARQVKSLLARYGLRPSKRLGQNFLIDNNVLERIVSACGAAPGIAILEIGAGLGTVTRALAAAGAEVVAVEFDSGLAAVLRESTDGVPGVRIIEGDFLDLDIESLISGRAAGEWRVVGNLPYCITTPIITRLLECRKLFSSAVLMVQREVAERLQAPPGTEHYGSLTVFVHYHCRVESVMKVSRNSFYPVPEVDSELIRLTFRSVPAVNVGDEQLFFAIVRAAFEKRRKTLANALGSSTRLSWDRDFARHVLEIASIDPVRRGETLSMGEFALLADAAAKLSS